MNLSEGVEVTLYRPVGLEELQLIAASGFKAFPPRLPDQPIFYPVTNEEYASQIAREWNTKTGSRLGFVTRFRVNRTFLDRFDRKIVGNKTHEEYWIPAEQLPDFNLNIAGSIEVVATFDGRAEEVRG